MDRTKKQHFFHNKKVVFVSVFNGYFFSNPNPFFCEFQIRRNNGWHSVIFRALPGQADLHRQLWGKLLHGEPRLHDGGPPPRTHVLLRGGHVQHRQPTPPRRRQQQQQRLHGRDAGFGLGGFKDKPAKQLMLPKINASLKITIVLRKKRRRNGTWTWLCSKHFYLVGLAEESVCLWPWDEEEHYCLLRVDKTSMVVKVEWKLLKVWGELNYRRNAVGYFETSRTTWKKNLWWTSYFCCVFHQPFFQVSYTWSQGR